METPDKKTRRSRRRKKEERRRKKKKEESPSALLFTVLDGAVSDSVAACDHAAQRDIRRFPLAPSMERNVHLKISAALLIQAQRHSIASVFHY